MRPARDCSVQIAVVWGKGLSEQVELRMKHEFREGEESSVVNENENLKAMAMAMERVVITTKILLTGTGWRGF